MSLASLIKTVYFAATVGLLASCEGPALPRAADWRPVGEIPEPHDDVGALYAVADDAVYIVGSFHVPGDTYSRGIVWHYDGDEIKEIYRAEKEGGGFSGINRWGKYFWISGSTQAAPDDSEPYVVRYDGTRWEILDVAPLVDELGLYAPYPYGEEYCLFRGNSNTVYSYHRGAWQKALTLKERAHTDFVATPGGRAFVYVFDYDTHETYMLASGDKGASWVREEVRLGGDLKFNNPYLRLYAGGENVFLEGSVSRVIYEDGVEREIRFNGIAERDAAPPGRGTYHVAFMTPNKPYFYEIRDMAFRDGLNGYAVGTQTSLARIAGEWVMEMCPVEWNLRFERVAAGPAAFWAVGSSDVHGGDVLYVAR